MRGLRVSKNAAKDWMNAPIDKMPEATPWTRVEGNKSRFALKKSPAACAGQTQARPSRFDARPLDLAGEGEEGPVEVIGVERHRLDAQVDVLAREEDVSALSNA
jgi:hypothetical protein